MSKSDGSTEPQALIDQLMNADDASGLDFFWFAERASEEVLYMDGDECESVQIILALIRRDTELALKMAERYRGPLRKLAENMLSSHLAKQRQG
jgi:hypothetical protein